MKTLARCAVGALLVVGALTAPSAATASEDDPILIDETYTETEISAALERAEDSEAAGRESAADENLEDRLIALADTQGDSLTDEDITVLHIGEVTAVVPETINLTEVEVVADGDSVSLSAEAESAEGTPSIASPGPGMGEWGSRVDGQYILTVRDPRAGTTEVIGTGTFLWSREKFLNDGNGDYDWWTYSRKGVGQPRNVVGDDWQIPKLRIQSYPYDSIETRLKNWTGFDPDTTFSGNCSGSISTGISVPVVNLGYSFQDCDKYVVWHNPENPGSYHITMDQGSWVNEGSRSVGYTLGWKSVQGTPGSMHDFQRILFQRGPNGSTPTTCQTYDASKTCDGW